MAVAEKKESFWKRHLVALILGGFGVLLLVIVAGQLLDKGDIARWLGEVPEQWAYVMCLLFVWFDAVIPIFPGETTLSAASTIAAGGGLTLGLIMVAGAVGAILGDLSTSLAGFPLASLVISSLITSAALAAVYFVERHKLKAGKDAESTAASAEPAVPSTTAGSGS